MIKHTLHHVDEQHAVPCLKQVLGQARPHNPSAYDTNYTEIHGSKTLSPSKADTMTSVCERTGGIHFVLLSPRPQGPRLLHRGEQPDCIVRLRTKPSYEKHANPKNGADGAQRAITRRTNRSG